MGRVHDQIEEPLRAFLDAQPMFFVATAPLAADGHVNVSPKGLSGTFSVIDPTTVAYLDLTGSGIETIAHLRENGRITLMFCAFEGPPRTVRISGRGEAVLPEDARFADLAARFAALPGTRAVIVVRADRIADSCGYAVPEMALVGQRDTLLAFAARNGEEGLATYRSERNAQSIDGLPGYPA